MGPPACVVLGLSPGSISEPPCPAPAGLQHPPRMIPAAPCHHLSLKGLPELRHPLKHLSRESGLSPANVLTVQMGMKVPCLPFDVVPWNLADFQLHA